MSQERCFSAVDHRNKDSPVCCGPDRPFHMSIFIDQGAGSRSTDIVALNDSPFCVSSDEVTIAVRLNKLSLTAGSSLSFACHKTPCPPLHLRGGGTGIGAFLIRRIRAGD